MTEVGARDRLVMAGLVVLGLLTVVAGVLSGRSTINYVLGRDAREAALSWAGEINKSLREQGPHAPQLLDKSLEVLDPERFASLGRTPASLPARSTSKDDATLVEDLDRLTTGWAMRLARRICTALAEPYHVNDHEVTSSASIGIAIGPLDSAAPDTLLKNADLALYRAKDDGRNTFRFFEPAMDAAIARASIEARNRLAARRQGHKRRGQEAEQQKA